MLHVVLVEPEIPPNTGNIMRLVHNADARLHLVEPLGFELDDRRMRRAGLDYLDRSRVERHASWQDYLAGYREARRYSFSTRHPQPYTGVSYLDDDHLVFGSETRGLPDSVRASIPSQYQVTLPMANGSRSLNLSNAVAIALYEAWRQLDFPGWTRS